MIEAELLILIVIGLIAIFQLRTPRRNRKFDFEVGPVKNKPRK